MSASPSPALPAGAGVPVDDHDGRARSISASVAGAGLRSVGAAPRRPKGPLSWSFSRSVRMMRLFNLLNGVLLVIFAIVSFLLPSGSLLPSFSSITIAGYVVFLGLLMCTVELNLAAVQGRVRRNFGFLFSFAGRAAFVLFAGSMALAMAFTTAGSSGATVLMVAVGTATMANAAFNALVIFFNPDFAAHASAATDPYVTGVVGSESAEEIAAAMARRNQALLGRAAGVAATSPVLNPYHKEAQAMMAVAPPGSGAALYSAAAAVPPGTASALYTATSVPPRPPGSGGVVDAYGALAVARGPGGTAAYAVLRSVPPAAVAQGAVAAANAAAAVAVQPPPYSAPLSPPAQLPLAVANPFRSARSMSGATPNAFAEEGFSY